MSSKLIIEARDLAKIFPIYDKPYHRLLQMFSKNKNKWHRDFFALKDLSFSIDRGQTVGIVGRNGSGKSTLLQIICGTLAPSAGSVRVHGRVAALLELGAGFNPDFTGRENIFLNGTVLGLTRAKISEKLESILSFAEIGDFIDRPVKTYSSGMYVRLAFAIAIHVEPDLLVVDEALSVGDEAFQRKCLARIEAMRKSGCTVLFVSHSSAMVIELCDRAILLDGGEILVDGQPKAVISRYQSMLYAPPQQAAELRALLKSEYIGGRESLKGALPFDEIDRKKSITHDQSDDGAYYDENFRSQSEVIYPSQGATIEDPHLETLEGRRVNVLKEGDKYTYSYLVHFERGVAGVRCGMLIKSTTGVEIAGAVSASANNTITWVEKGTTLRVEFTFACDLAGGVYFMNAGVLGRVNEEETYLHRWLDAVMFRVTPGPERLATGFVNLVRAASIQASRANTLNQVST